VWVWGAWTQRLFEVVTGRVVCVNERMTAFSSLQGFLMEFDTGLLEESDASTGSRGDTDVSKRLADTRKRRRQIQEQSMALRVSAGYGARMACSYPEPSKMRLLVPSRRPGYGIGRRQRHGRSREWLLAERDVTTGSTLQGDDTTGSTLQGDDKRPQLGEDDRDARFDERCCVTMR
jgi:hypothetical protein